MTFKATVQLIALVFFHPTNAFARFFNPQGILALVAGIPFFIQEIPMNEQTVRTQLPALVSGHVPRNAQRFKFRLYSDQPQESMLGFKVDPKPFEGRVIAITDETIVIKTGRIDFAVVDRQLATQVPEEGVKVSIQPYARRRFDGLRADTPDEETQQLSDGTSYTVKKLVLGSAPAKLPIPAPRCEYLQSLIDLLEQTPAPDGYRRITHLMVDAGARDITWVDPKPDDIFRTPPAINFTVNTAKFEGQVSLLYERELDLYAVELHRNGELIQRVSQVYFDDVGEVLERLIDDGSWRQIQVQVIPERKAVKH